MKIVKMHLLALVCLAATLSVHAQTLDEIIDKNLTAIGGKDKLLALNSMVTEGTLNISGQEVKIKVTQVNNKGQRVDITFGGMSGYTIQTRDSGWTYLPFQGQKKAEATPADIVKEGADLLDLQGPLLDYKTKGHTVELLGKDDVDGTECFKLKLVTKSGLEQTLFIDPATWYVIKQVTKTKAGGQEKEETATFSNFKKLDSGYSFPFSLTGFGPGELKVTKIDVNPVVDPSSFIPSN
jgi:outer membrane lipoprotein-sorting protein